MAFDSWLCCVALLAPLIVTSACTMADAHSDAQSYENWGSPRPRHIRVLAFDSKTVPLREARGQWAVARDVRHNEDIGANEYAVLYVSSGNTDNATITAAQRFPDIKAVWLVNCDRVTSQELQSIAQLRQLEALEIRGGTTIEPNALGALAGNRSLRTVVIDPLIGEDDLATLSKLATIEKASLRFSRSATPDAIHSLRHLTNLKELSVRRSTTAAEWELEDRWTQSDFARTLDAMTLESLALYDFGEIEGPLAQAIEDQPRLKTLIID